ncbi:MAG: amidohydrolase family protein, partial [Armatimonadota bacterium]|nr:amidohydrolase family protein [Armatimonadota bacterium]
MDSILSALREYISHIPLTDTHEHLTPEVIWLEQEPDISIFFTHYASSDLVSSGMPAAEMARFKGNQLSHDEKWELLEPHWLRARNTTYCRSVDMAARDLFDLPGLSRETYKTLLERMRDVRHPGWYRKVLKDKANIEISILDKWTPHIDRTLFVPSVRFDEFATVSNRSELAAIAETAGTSIYSLTDLLKALDLRFKAGVEYGMVGVKCGLAYNRPLYFDNTTRHEAEIVFNKILKDRGNGPSWQEAKPLQDYIVHQIIRRAADLGLPMLFHTGIQEGTGNFIADSDPTLLNNLFFTYKNVKFDVFHAGFPYSRELGVLAKNFSNVYPDMCWMHIIGAKSARMILDEWLDLVPANKILGFGGDYRFVEGIYAHAQIARENVARVLADRVERGDQTMDEAVELAGRILRLN